MMRTQRVAVLAAMAVAAVLLAGCRVETDKNGDSDDVKISTPFGGMQVKTNDAVTLENIGLAAYPGAQRVKRDDDNGAADVDMSFGSFQLRVKAASYRTGDSPAKVEAFYRNDMKRFGDVIACRNHRVVGTPAKTLEGLTCGSGGKSHDGDDGDSDEHKLELKAGSKLHQHIVSIDPDGSGTKFGLVALDLPHESEDDGQQ